MKYNKNIEKHFHLTYEKDKGKYIKKWMVSWDYQDKYRKNSQNHLVGFPSKFYRYSGPCELIKWFNWISHQKRPDYFSDEDIEPLVEISREYDFKLLESLSLEFDRQKYDECIGRYNAQDYLFQNMYPTPERYKINNILDFGAGYGRQANIWTQRNGNIVYVGMDAIPLAYCLQHLYYSHLDLPYLDYVLDPFSFKINKSAGIYHLPTWRYDLLPDSFFDIITCVQVLKELNLKLVRHLIKHFHRALKPGGILYIRDDPTWKPVYNVDINKCLEKEGFTIEFNPFVKQGTDIHGIPRIWRKVDL
jgi:SAM-dependent methyltransferase